MSATVTPGMPAGTDANVTGVGLLCDEVHQRGSAKLLRHGPGTRLVDVHQRCFYSDGPVNAQRDSAGQRLQRFVAAIGIPGVVGLAHAADQRGDPRRQASAAA